jgi:hypothetical protein
MMPLDGPIKYGAMQAILGSDPDRSAEIRLSGWPCSNRYAVFGLVIAAADSAQDTLSSASDLRCLSLTNCRELLAVAPSTSASAFTGLSLLKRQDTRV